MQIDPRFVWDYDLSGINPADEAVQRWYVARVLSRGTLADVRAIGLETIRRFLPSLTLPATTRHFWETYFALLDQDRPRSRS